MILSEGLIGGARNFVISCYYWAHRKIDILVSFVEDINLSQSSCFSQCQLFSSPHYFKKFQFCLAHLISWIRSICIPILEDLWINFERIQFVFRSFLATGQSSLVFADELLNLVFDFTLFVLEQCDVKVVQWTVAQFARKMPLQNKLVQRFQDQTFQPTLDSISKYWIHTR